MQIKLGDALYGNSEVTDYWDVANKTAIVFTIAGTLFTFGTFYLVGSLRKQLVKKERLPEVHVTLKQALPEIRAALGQWSEANKHEALGLIYAVKGHLQNVRPSIGKLERGSLDKIVLLIDSKRLYFFKKDITVEQCWEIQRELHTFVALLEGHAKDNEVTRV